tara:strand:+ start:97 stop:267 length:171 start_codon:yes stop_codon:yes gene_type:complete
MMQMMEVKPRGIHTMARYLNISQRSVYRYLHSFKEIGYKVSKNKLNKYKITRTNEQ